MIKWNCNFNIPDSTVQLSEAFVRVFDFTNANNHSEVNIQITDLSGEVIVKEYTQNFDRTFLNDKEIYEVIITEFQDSEIVSGEEWTPPNADMM